MTPDQKAILALTADNERLRGLLREALPHIYIPDDCDRTDEIRDKIDAALADAAVQPNGATDKGRQ